MERKMDTTIRGYIGTNIGIHSSNPSWPQPSPSLGITNTFKLISRLSLAVGVGLAKAVDDDSGLGRFASRIFRWVALIYNPVGSSRKPWGPAKPLSPNPNPGSQSPQPL